MQASARIRISGRDIEISHPEPFGPGDIDRLLHRAFAHADTDSVHLEPLIRRFKIRLGSRNTDTKASLARLADLMAQPSVPEESLPEVPGPSPVTFQRWRGIVTSLNLQDQALGQVRVGVPRKSSGGSSGNHFKIFADFLECIRSERAAIRGASSLDMTPRWIRRSGFGR